MSKFTIAISIILAAAQSAHAICYVNAGVAGGANDGSAWTNAYSDLQSALTDTHCAEIWVAKGIYKPTNTSDRSVSFIIRPNVAVYGGFSGDGSESIRDSRDFLRHVTVLSGDIDNNDANAATTGIDETAEDIIGANSLHVVAIDGRTPAGKVLANTVLDGFTITGGEASDAQFDFPANSGAGLFCNGEGAGNECSPSLANLLFSGNSAEAGFGGAVLNDAGAGGVTRPIVHDVRFASNIAMAGGAMCNGAESPGSDSSPELQRAAFINNRAKRNFDVVPFGGAVLNVGGSSPTFTDVVFAGNRSDDRGGAVANLSSSGTSDATFVNVLFSQNIAGNRGGAIYNLGVDFPSSPALLNVTLAGNEANNRGGAIYNDASNGGQSSPLIVNSTFSGNLSARGGAIYNDASTLGTSNPTLRNVILWADDAVASDAEVFEDSSSSDIDFSVVDGGCPFSSTCGMHLLTGDPLLSTLSDHGGFSWTMLPAIAGAGIDSGDNSLGDCPTSDQRNAPRADFHCDIGAVERQPIEDIIFRNGYQSF